jgi:putative endonuclease
MATLPSNHNRSIGKIGEDTAVEYIENRGYKVIDRNYTSRWGEIDIISEKDGVLVFVEVKTKIGDKYGAPWESVTFFKYQKLKRSIQYYITSNKHSNRKCRIDVCGVLLNPDLTVESVKLYEGR